MTWTAALVCICIGVICGVLSGIYIRFVSSRSHACELVTNAQKLSLIMTVATVVVLILHIPLQCLVSINFSRKSEHKEL